MNEYEETPSIYVWPSEHVEGEPYPEDFWERVQAALKAARIEWESA